MPRCRTFGGHSLLVRIGLGMLVVVVVVAILTVVALRRVPAFYREALDQDTQAVRQASREMGSRATALFNAVRRRGVWRALFTADQINGYLAVDLVKNHPHLLADGIDRPRVAIRGDHLLIAFRWHAAGMTTVGSMELVVYLVEPNVVACRIVAVRAGGLPVPRAYILRSVSRSAAHMDVALQWTRADGDPVALLTIRAGGPPEGPEVWLERLELADGRVYLVGHTGHESASPAGGSPPPACRLRSARRGSTSGIDRPADWSIRSGR